MKPFPEHDQEWVASLPYYGTVSPDGRTIRCAGMFPGSRSARRQDIEGGFVPGAQSTPEERWFNAFMVEHAAAFADIVSSHTKALYGRTRTVAILRILSIAWRRASELHVVPARGWFHSVCQEAMA